MSNPTNPAELPAKERKKSQQETSGCENPFVPVTTSQFSRFKQLSTRRGETRSSRGRSSSGPHVPPPPTLGAGPGGASGGDVGASGPGGPTPGSPPPFDFTNGVTLVAANMDPQLVMATRPPFSSVATPTVTGTTMLPSAPPPQVKPVGSVLAQAPEGTFMDPGEWTVFDETQDHPGRRKNSGFFQPIKHLSGKSEQYRPAPP